MKQVLTDGEVMQLAKTWHGSLTLARAIEAAVLAKFEQVGFMDSNGCLWELCDDNMLPSDVPLYAIKEAK